MRNLRSLLKLLFIISLAMWLAACCGRSNSEPTVYAIGDTGPVGGIVFYITDGGLHGLEAAPVDQGAEKWCSPSVTLFGANGTAIGTGAQNTADIIDAGCGQYGSVAATLADAYTLNGFSDWFLPSREELRELYLNRAVVGGFASYFYWSSSRDTGLTAWYFNFITGSASNTYTQYDYKVRAIRSF